MKILIAVHSLRTGGITTSLYNICEILAENNQIDLIVLDKSYNDLFSSNVNIINTPNFIYSANESIKNIVKEKKYFALCLAIIARTLYKIFGRRFGSILISKIAFRQKKVYDLSISFSNDIYSNDKCIMSGCNQFIGYAVKSSMKAGWIHADLSQIGYDRAIILKTYKRFDYIVNLSIASMEIIKNICPDYSSRYVYIHNIVNIKKINDLAGTNSPYNNGINIVTVSRIENYTKRLDRVIEISKILIKNGLIFQWHLIGDGIDKSSLLEKIRTVNLDRFISMHGNKPNPYPYIKHANLMVITSDFEAFPMVVLEAKALQVPIVSTNFPAAKEMCIDKNGLITDKNVDSLSQAILGILKQQAALNNNDVDFNQGISHLLRFIARIKEDINYNGNIF